MQLLEHSQQAPQIRIPDAPGSAERSARSTLRRQIARLEAEFADAFVTAFGMRGVEFSTGVTGEPRLLSLGELEQIRDDLAERLRSARVAIAERADVIEENRVTVERMLLDPAEHRYERISLRDCGQPGCGVYQVKPRMGLVGMLRGWWVLKLSSGCPLPRGYALVA